MEEDQEKHLEDAKKIVREQGYFMKQALNQQSLRDALRYSTVMLSELKTTLLSPRNYFQLFMQIFDELRTLESYFKEEYHRGRRMMDLYESVQHAQFIIPRLYLLITVGSVYIESQEAKSKEILSDLLECIKGVQNPLKGLFLRYYFLMLCKDKLPDVGNQYEGEGGDVNDSINCILKNLTEMNNLWIRMQGNKDKSKREKERVDLRITVGENLSRLSKLHGVNKDIYTNMVFPRLYELIETTKDTISQQYLIDCLIQVFPDEYHLLTIESLLTLITQKVEAKVDSKHIIQTLMNRLGQYALTQPLPDDLDLFSVFSESLNQLLITQTYPSSELIPLYLAFTQFSLATCPNNLENINIIMSSVKKLPSDSFDDSAFESLSELLQLPLKTLKLSIIKVKDLQQVSDYISLLKRLPMDMQKKVAYQILQAALQQGLNGVSELKYVMEFIDCVIEEGSGVEGLWCVFREEQMEMLNLWEQRVENIKGLKWGVAEGYLKLGLQGDEGQNIAKKVKGIIDEIKDMDIQRAIHMSFRLAMAINEFDKEKEMDEFTFEVISDAMCMYQDEINDSADKKELYCIILGYLCNISCLSAENYDILVSNAANFATVLLKKYDQCLAVLKCTHLFFNPEYKNEKRIFECFKKCLKLADICLQQNNANLYLYIQILEKFLYYLKHEISTLKIQDVQGCINLIKSKLGDDANLNERFQSTCEFIQRKKDISPFDQLEI